MLSSLYVNALLCFWTWGWGDKKMRSDVDRLVVVMSFMVYWSNWMRWVEILIVLHVKCRIFLHLLIYFVHPRTTPRPQQQQEHQQYRNATSFPFPLVQGQQVAHCQQQLQNRSKSLVSSSDFKISSVFIHRFSSWSPVRYSRGGWRRGRWWEKEQEAVHAWPPRRQPNRSCCPDTRSGVQGWGIHCPCEIHKGTVGRHCGWEGINS